MSRKILVVLTIGMFLGVTSFSAIGVKQSLNSRISCLFGSKFAVNFGGDRLDQQQTECNKGLLILGHTTEGKPGKITNRVVFGFAQTFTYAIVASWIIILFFVWQKFKGLKKLNDYSLKRLRVVS